MVEREAWPRSGGGGADPHSVKEAINIITAKRLAP